MRLSPIRATLLAAAGAAAALTLLGAGVPDDEAQGRSRRGATNRYIGANACNNCHKAAHKGNQNAVWASKPHAKAFETLGTAKAKEIGAKHGVTDPQKSPKCLECHTTAHGAGRREIKRGFDVELGVQCESCHGPGEKHAKARFAAAAAGGETEDYVKIPAGEIVTDPGVDACLKCHNEKSPTYEPFCYKVRAAEIEHLDPRVERDDAARKAMERARVDACKCKDCAAERAARKAGADPADAAGKKGAGKKGAGKKG